MGVINMKKIKLGIIGCGIITKDAHVPALKNLSQEVEVIAVCNRSKEKALDIALDLNLQVSAVWTDWEKMIAALTDLDAILVALPINMNHPVSKACCAAGLSVLCEKPAGMSNAEAEDTKTFSEKYGVTYMTGENVHYIPHITKAVELVESGIIGNVHSLVWNQFQFMEIDNKFNQTKWRSKNEHPGGYVLDGGVHSVHALKMIAGPIKSVYSRTKSIEKGLGTMDTTLSTIEHDNGIVSSFNIGWRAINDDDNLKIYGDKGTLIVKEREGVVEQLTPEGKTTVFEITKNTGTGNSFYLEWCDFINAVKTKTAPSMPSQAPVDDIKVVMAIIESGETSKIVML